MTALAAIADPAVMTTDRPYRPARPADAAPTEVQRLSGAQSTPAAGGLLRDALQWWAAAA